jgi:hypothetical protein
MNAEMGKKISGQEHSRKSFCQKIFLPCHLPTSDPEKEAMRQKLYELINAQRR